MFNFRKKLQNAINSLKKEKEDQVGFFTRTISGSEIKIKNADDYFYTLGAIRNKLEYMMTSKERQEVDEMIEVVYAYIQKDIAYNQPNRPKPNFTTSLDKCRDFMIAVAPNWYIIEIKYCDENQSYQCKLRGRDIPKNVNLSHRHSIEASMLYAGIEAALYERDKEVFEQKQADFKARNEGN